MLRWAWLSHSDRGGQLVPCDSHRQVQTAPTHTEPTHPAPKPNQPEDIVVTLQKYIQERAVTAREKRDTEEERLKLEQTRHRSRGGDQSRRFAGEKGCARRDA